MEYHLAGVPQFEQSGFDLWHQTFDVRDLLGGGIGREKGGPCAAGVAASGT
jgi:hypothetical protein